MKYSMISDSHIHSNCSFDGLDSVDEICKKAISLNMHSITITDHFESYLYYNNQDDKYGNFKVLIPKSISEIKKAQVKYDGELNIYCGLEVGEPLHDGYATQKVMTLANFDFLLGSIHCIKGYEDFYFLEYTKESAREMLSLYFQEVYTMVKFCNFDSVAHLTYPLRYMVGRDKIDISIDDFKEEIDEILKLIIEKNVAIEVNSSGLRQEIGVTLPEIDVIKRYKELGGKYVTVGSDAHNVNDLASGIEEVYDMLIECGFKNYTVYDKRMPRLINIK